jgi:hypothetical protein
VARLLTLSILLALGAPLTLSPTVRAQTTPSPRPVDEQVVFTVDGSGWLRGIGDDIRQVLGDVGSPVQVECFVWSHGPGRILADLHDHDHQKTKGQELAEMILAHRQLCPVGKVYVVCHSSGAAVVMAAAQCLPADAVERIVFLAPALAPGYDLRPALRATRRGLDSFHSQGDMIGGFVLAVMGNADGQFETSASCVGFTQPADDAHYANLRQHAWDWDMGKTGYFGGHFGCTRPAFLRAYIVPLLTVTDNPPAPDRKYPAPAQAPPGQ